MPDILTPEERAAIAAFPAEKVRHCARGESGLPIHGFSMRDRIRISAGSAKRNALFMKNREIDELIRALCNEGLTDEEISEKVKLKPKTVWMRRYRMSLASCK